MKCCACNSLKVFGFFASSIAPVTVPYCKRCKEQNIEPYDFLLYHFRGISSLCGIDSYDMKIITSTCLYNQITIEEFISQSKNY